MPKKNMTHIKTCAYDQTRLPQAFWCVIYMESGNKNQQEDTMSDKFRIYFKIDRDINEPEDIETLESSMEKAQDACDCGAKGVVLCQIYTNEYGIAVVEGKFVNNDVAKKIVKLTLEA
jgi:hypothetical protein